LGSFLSLLLSFSFFYFTFFFSFFVEILPISDKNLIANLSASDLRGMEPLELQQLAWPVLDFIKVSLADFPGLLRFFFSAFDHVYSILFLLSCVRQARHQGQIPTPITAQPRTGVAEVIRLLIGSRIHRVWIVERDSFVPVACVTMGDLVRFAVET
jgi:hypothetical protein